MCDHFRDFMVEGAQLNQAKLKENIGRSVMMVTALSPIIGYDKTSVISHYAIDNDLTLKQAALANGVTEDLFDRVVKPLALHAEAQPISLRGRRPGEPPMTSMNREATRMGDNSMPIGKRPSLRLWEVNGGTPTGQTRTIGCAGYWPSSWAWPGLRSSSPVEQRSWCVTEGRRCQSGRRRSCSPPSLRCGWSWPFTS